METERKQAEQLFTHAETLFRGLVEFAPDALVITDREGRIQLVNSQTERLFGYRRDELLGQPVETLMPERFRSCHAVQRAAYLVDPHLKPMGAGLELYGRRKDGSAFPVDISLSPLKGEQDMFVTAAIRDVTERKRAEEEIRRLTEELEAASRHKSEFLANMSHELRTPLNSIIGFAELLRDQTYGPLSAKQGRYVGHIHNSGHHLLALINDLLDLSKVEAGRLDLRLEVFELHEALTTTLIKIQPQADAKRLELKLHVDERLSTITADPVRFTQIVLNLLSNAVKFTPKRGWISVTATRASDESVELCVADSGIGITSEDLGRLFQGFSRLDAARAMGADGTGLGLTLTKRLVELHGGRIWAASDGEGRGSTFTVHLPLSPPGEPRKRKDVAEESGPTPHTGAGG